METCHGSLCRATRGKLWNIQTRSIYFYLFISLHSTHSQPTYQSSSQECSSETRDKMTTLCLISANPTQKLKVLFSVSQSVWLVAQLISQFSMVVLSCNHVDCRPVRTAEYQYQYAGDGDGDLLLHIRSRQMSPELSSTATALTP